MTTREKLLKKYSELRELHRKQNDILNEMKELIKDDRQENNGK